MRSFGRSPKTPRSLTVSFKYGWSWRDANWSRGGEVGSLVVVEFAAVLVVVEVVAVLLVVVEVAAVLLVVEVAAVLLVVVEVAAEEF